MKTPSELKVFPLKDCESPWFNHVLKLWGINRKTLGFMPEMGFVEYANKGTVLVAISGDNFLGYAMYGISRGWARLIHLSVESSANRTGVATKILEELKKVTTDLDGVFLSCRKDYNLDGLWRKSNFHYRFDRPGRSRQGHLISRWSYEHTSNSIIIAGNEPRIAGQSRAIIDTNVFLDFTDTARPNHESASALQDDQLAESLELWVTNELATEVRNNPISKEALGRFQLASVDQHACEQICNELKAIHPPKNQHSIIDQRQLASAIAFGADYFITRDSEILEHFGSNTQISEKYDIQVILPEQALLMQDELLNANKYIRREVGSSQWTIKSLAANDLQSCADYFSNSNFEGNPSALYAKIKKIADDIHGTRAFVMRDEAEELVAMWLYEKNNDLIIASTIRYKQAKIRYKEAVHRRILMHAMDHAAKQMGGMISLFVQLGCASEPEMLNDVGLRLGFEKDESEKGIFKKVISFTADGLDDQRIAQFLIPPIDATSPRFAYNVERKFWPLKIRNTSLGAVIISIHPMWFERLFGGQQLCIDLPLFIALNDDQVYYRRIKNNLALRVPSRVVWYVTKGNNSQGSMSYQACSYLDSIETGAAKQLFEKYKRMGAYSWSEISELAKGDGRNSIMVVRFSMTEIFKKKIPRKTIGDDILKKHGHERELRANLVAPLRISESAFHELYESAMS